LPVRLPGGIPQARLLDSMSRDKKNRMGDIHFALISRAGEMHRSDTWTTAVPIHRIEAALTAIAKTKGD
jgi:3-dehydroquinate synthetase